MHRCPADGCSLMVNTDKLMCYKHWKLVPEDIQKKVYRTYYAKQRNGTQANEQAHYDAMQEAIEAVNE